nr:MFS transporter [Nitratireductor soli]
MPLARVPFSLLALVVGGSCLTAMSGTAITAALPDIAAEFAGPQSELLSKLVLTIPAAFTAASAPLFGSVINRFGLSRTFALGALLFAFAGVSGMFAIGIEHLIIGRAALGIAVAALLTATMVLIGQNFTGREREWVLGLQAAATSFGGMALLLAGGLLADYSWRITFAVYLIGLLILPLLAQPFPAAKKEAERHGHTDWRSLAHGCTALFLGANLFYVIPVQLPFALDVMTDSTPAWTGFALAVCTFAGGVTGALFGVVRGLARPATLLGVSLLVISAGQSLVTHLHYSATLVGMVLSGIGVGMLLPATNSIVARAAVGRSRSRAVGIAATCLFLAQFTAPLTATVLSASGFGVFSASAMLTAAAGAAFLIAALRQED